MRTGTSRNGLLAGGLVAVVVMMVGLSFAAVPFYRWFCQVTGFGGTTQVASTVPESAVTGRRVTIRFNADVDPRLPWRFWPEQRSLSLAVGEPGVIIYRARNLTARDTVGVATFNVTPEKAGAYFNKVQCFCFDNQPLKAGEEAEMGVSFFVDPAMLDDPNMAEVDTITLSYTFFRDLADLARLAEGEEPAASLQGVERVAFAGTQVR